MSVLRELRRDKLDAALRTNARVLQIIQAAMAMGVLSFGMVVAFIAFNFQPSTDEPVRLGALPLLSIVNGAIVLAGFFYSIPGGILAGIIAGLIVGPWMPLDVELLTFQPTQSWITRTLGCINISG